MLLRNANFDRSFMFRFLQHSHVVAIRGIFKLITLTEDVIRVRENFLCLLSKLLAMSFSRHSSNTDFLKRYGFYYDLFNNYEISFKTSMELLIFTLN